MRLRKDKQRKRQDEAKARQASWSEKTPTQQLKDLDGRAGASKRQRTRLAQVLAAAKA